MWKRAFVFMLALLLGLPAGSSFAAGDSPHWVYGQMSAYKQRITKLAGDSSMTGPITKEEWNSFRLNVLNEEKLDEPIEIYHWATMIKMGVELPKGEEDRLLESYIYGQASSSNSSRVTREAAVGGLVKLLSFNLIQASWSISDGDAAKVFSDFGDISDKQMSLVQIAYRDGLLDSGTKGKFRPREYLTNAEAISMLDKTMRKYEETEPLLDLPKGHWAYEELKRLYSKKRFTREHQRQLQAGLSANEPIPVSLWHELLAEVLGFSPSRDSARVQYTFGLARGEFLGRDYAVAGLMKLWGPSRDATEEERKAASAAFDDYSKAFDTSKLAIAYKLGIVQGYGTSFHPERVLSYGEAVTLLSRVAVSSDSEKGGADAQP